jgi:XTP/dITP diphosphohydrolase
MRIVLASGNARKRAEIGSILAGLDVELVPMTDLGLVGPEEDGETFEENALLKARSIVEAVGEPAIADDSGLEVDALHGAPGVRSARYAGPDARDDDNNRKLMAALRDLPVERRTARFVCAAAFVAPDGVQRVVRGTMEGRLTDAPRGEQGFGYDPYFVADGEERTNAQLHPREKDARSHRGAAFRELRPHVEAWVRAERHHPDGPAG